MIYLTAFQEVRSLPLLMLLHPGSRYDFLDIIINSIFYGIGIIERRRGNGGITMNGGGNLG